MGRASALRLPGPVLRGAPVVDRPLYDIEWVLSHLDDIADLTLEHIWLSAIAVSVGFLISFVLAVLTLGWRPIYGPITVIAGVIYTIPSLALFAALVPFYGLSVLTAEIALIGYTILILFRNIVTAIDGVPADAREAADGMGFTRPVRLVRVELPLAVPVIIAGLRIATVTTVGLVTVSALIGQGGLGRLIEDGLRRSFPTMTITGAVLSVVLAVLADAGFVVAQRLLTPWSHGRSIASGDVTVGQAV